MSDQKKDGKISRREMLRLTAMGAAGLVATTTGGEALASGIPSPVSAPSRSLQQKVKLRIQVNNAKDEQPIIDFFISKVPNVEVEALEVTGIDHEEVAGKILSLIAAGQPPDIGYAATEALELYAGKKLAAPLTDRAKADAKEMVEYFKDVHPSLVEAMMYEGDLYELPRDFNAPNMYLNSKLVTEAGLEMPKPDWDKDTFYKYAKAMTKKNDKGETQVFGYAWVNRLWGSWTPWIFVNNSNLLTEERAPGGERMWDTFYKDDPAGKGRGGGWRWLKAKANDPANVEALDFMVQLTKEGLAPDIQLGIGETLNGFFTSGKLGMTPAGGHFTGYLYRNGMAADAYDVQLWPKWKSQRHEFGTGGKWLAAASKAPDIAWQYLKLEVSVDGMKANGIFFPVTLTTPSRRSFCTAERFAKTGPKNWQIFYDTLDKHPDTAPIPAPPQSNPVTQALVKYTGLAMTSQMTAKEALDALQKELETVLARK